MGCSVQLPQVLVVSGAESGNESGQWHVAAALAVQILDKGNCENDKPEFCGYIHPSVTSQEATNLANALATTTPGRLQHDGVANPVAAPQRLLYSVYTGLYKDKKGNLVANVAVALLPNWDL